MTTFTRQKFAEIMRELGERKLTLSQIGFIKEPYAGPPAKFGMGTWPTCAATAHYAANQAGLDMPIMCPSKFGYTFALVEAWQKWAQEKGFYIVNDGKVQPEAGDVGIIDWNKTSVNQPDTDWDDHVVVVLGMENGMVLTAEGNASGMGTGLYKRNPIVFEGFVRIEDGYSFTAPKPIVAKPDQIKEKEENGVFFNEIVTKLIDIEGGYVNHPADKGGPTKYGITQRTLGGYLGRSVSATDVQNLTVEKAKEIYLNNYWNPLNLSGVKKKNVASLLFDQSVNRGPKKAAVMAQQTLNKYFLKGLVEDGDIGPLSTAALNSVDEKQFVLYFMFLAQDDYADIVRRDPSQSVFICGWINRTQEWGKYLL